MPVKNNDDVAHLLDATGTAGSSYREFENPSDHMHAPLIEAVFASGPPEEPADASQGVGGSRSDLLSEVFDAPKPAEKPEVRVSAPSIPTRPPDVPAESPVRAPPGAAAGRSLSDIRRIISRPVTEAPSASPPDSLHGVFDRLAS
jgi:hypothetical protein